VNGRRVALLLLILVMGGAVDAAWFLRHNVGVGPIGCRVMGGRFHGDSFSFDAEDRRPLAAGTTVEVENSFGTVRVVQSPTTELRVSLRKVVYRDSEDKARAFAERLHLVIEPGATLRVTTNREELDRADFDDDGFETHLELALPKGTPVVVRNEHGRVDVADVPTADVSGSYEEVRVARVAGAAEVRARHADVSVSEVAGRLALSSRHGSVQVEDVPAGGTLDVEHGEIRVLRVGALTVKAVHGSLSVQDVRGDLEVHAAHVDVDAQDVTGRATIETSNDGIQVRRVSGEVHLKTEHGSISAAEVDGALTAHGTYEDVELTHVRGAIDVRVEHAALRASDLAKGGRVSMLGGEVSILRFAGPLDIDAQRSTIELEPAGALIEPVLARTTFGDIHLRVPEGSRMAFEANSANGDLLVDVPGLALTREGGHATGTLAGGTNAVRLVADHGSVEVASRLKASASDEKKSGEDDEDQDDDSRQ
jgi:Toastrack DUF4097